MYEGVSPNPDPVTLNSYLVSLVRREQRTEREWDMIAYVGVGKDNQVQIPGSQLSWIMEKIPIY